TICLLLAWEDSVSFANRPNRTTDRVNPAHRLRSSSLSLRRDRLLCSELTMPAITAQGTGALAWAPCARADWPALFLPRRASPVPAARKLAWMPEVASDALRRPCRVRAGST